MNELYLGNCLDIMKSIPDQKIDLVLTDPPYGIGINKMSFARGQQSGLAKRGDYRGMCDWDSQRIGPEFFKEMLRISKNQIIFGGNYYTDILVPTKSWIVWDKKRQDKFHNDFADCELAWCSLGQARIFRYLWHGMIQQNMKEKEKRYHPTQKPVGLFRQILEEYSQKGQLVCDPFMGVGSVGIACQELGRGFVGIEINQGYFDIANRRINQTTENLL
jgi:site-specific DNA-methyltransferase (adenine-specific)